MKTKLISASVIALLSLGSHAGKIYHCKNDNGGTSFQDRPCKGETIKIDDAGSSGVMSKEHMIKVLARMTGKDEESLEDPKVRQAAEVLVATDAGKAYAFTKIYGVAAEYCRPPVFDQLQIYEDKANEVISLGRYYYDTGMYFQIGNNDISHTGQELRGALEEMLEKERSKYKYSSKPELDKLCKEALDALKSLTMLYSS